MRARGFTLVELMLTVALIGILAIATVPNAMQAIQRREAAVAAQNVLDLVEFARTQASLRNRAYSLRIDANAGPGSTLQFQVVEGPTPSCGAFLPIETPDTPIPGPNKGVQVRTMNFGVEYRTVRMTGYLPTDLDASPLCFRPDGRVFQVVEDATPRIVPATRAGFTAGEARISFRRFNRNGGGEGPTHSVVVPFNGNTRLSFQ